MSLGPSSTRRAITARTSSNCFTAGLTLRPCSPACQRRPSGVCISAAKRRMSRIVVSPAPCPSPAIEFDCFIIRLALARRRQKCPFAPAHISMARCSARAELHPAERGPALASSATRLGARHARQDQRSRAAAEHRPPDALTRDRRRPIRAIRSRSDVRFASASPPRRRSSRRIRQGVKRCDPVEAIASISA